MQFVKDIFLNLSDPGEATDLILTVLIFLGVSALLIYLIYLGITKLTKPNIHLDYQLQLNFLWALVVFMFVFCVYLGFLINEVGLGVFEFEKPEFYIKVLPHLFVLLGVSMLFFFRLSRLNRSIQTAT